MARTHRTPAQWQQLIEEQKHSGLNITQYCQQHSLTISGFYAWRKRLKIANNTLATDEVSNDWLKVEMPVAEPVINSEPNSQTWDIELQLPNGVVLKMQQQSC